jgi:general secretion pathway protein I
MPRFRTPIRMPPPRQHGFTLVELVAAFVIFALGFGILLQVLSSCLHTTAQSADYTRAALWAQSLLDPLGVGEPLREGGASGRFDDRYRWQLSIAKIDPPEPLPSLGAAAAAQPGNANTQGPAITNISATAIDLYRIELVVTWGTYYMTHSARFVTMRSATPENAGPDSGGFLPNMPQRGQGVKR